ncbi:hypothetical protein CMI42_06450 [Candidatus Pacearchaeota archaeon]|nr:hypothetical protein [Candidatus Pacearchaeota archaeon]
MRIRVIYDKDLGLLKIPVTLKSSHKRISVLIVVDTGSPNTLLNYTDSRMLNIPFIEPSGIIKIGGDKYRSYSYNKIEIIFKSLGGDPIAEKIPVKILRPSSSRIDDLEELDSFPNILGLDFLRLGYKFICDLQNNEIYLEKQEESKKDNFKNF